MSQPADWTRLPHEEHRQTSDLFFGMSGLSVRMDYFGQRYLENTRRRCPVQILFNGARVSLITIDTWSISSLDAIEVYRGQIEAPTEYSMLAKCGLVMLWSRRR